MNEGNIYIKKIKLQILRAQNLLHGGVQKNKSSKWRVVIVGGEKKYMTNVAKCSEGHPFWNSEVEIELTEDQNDSIVLIIADDSTNSKNQFGQIVIPLNQIPPKEESTANRKHGSAVLQESNLEPNDKCSNPTGCLFYRIWVHEYFDDKKQKHGRNYTKRTSIFKFKRDQKENRKSLDFGSSQLGVNHNNSSNIKKRFSLFKSQEKINELNQNRSKSKSVTNIFTIEDDDNYHTSDSDSQQNHYVFPVTSDFHWTRVEDVITDKSKLNYDSYSINEGEQNKVEVFSVQPDHGPITGNFTVVMEGNNFTSGLFDLTYVIIDGLEPFDATSCTSILSDTELLLTMPPICIPGIVNIHLELLDGTKISCTKKFYYTDSNVDTTHCSGLTPRPFDNQNEDLSVNDKFFDQYDDILTSSMNSYNCLKSGANVVSEVDCFNEYDYRKRSDYGSQGSLHSDREKSASKLQPDDEKEKLRKENLDLRMKLSDLESSTTGQMLALRCQLKSHESLIDNISRAHCNLKMRLLEDGLTKYLELI